MGQKVAGTCYVKIDGTQLILKGGVEAPLMDKTRETVVPGYFKEEDKAPFVKLTAVHTPNFPLKALTEGINMTLTAELQNGKVYTLSGAYLVSQPTSKGEDGTLELQFDGIKGVWS
ncbi:MULTISPECIES: phage tail tube protein [unclassified Pseudomonas]|uniref:phage tail tube protein n=1 Tax=unclassified Pseudomonas TaxID=196821 RepID=UPI000BD5D7A8|nr:MULTISPECIES: phage tail tube protein [unclassified Pseudomonas]PVZ12646.1 tail tube protein [Pseudomonas sp. URIL14HWK12:I12]PVZ23203.1 tail tube protein [Pseudomonas sp. URIL14HWK12:I10]PVZ32532.1 tail tube protein [Pseudomonas sp. URIL14HWK12:I11]SNZ13612.1 Phage tail tube protein [Pseudomonas sp. URIL14HWK12:I9]